MNILHLAVSEIWPRQDFKGQDHYNKGSKVKSKSHYDIVHLHLLHLTVSEIWQVQDFKGQGHTARSKVKSWLHYDIAHLHLTNVHTKYEQPKPYTFSDMDGQDFSHRPTTRPTGHHG